jgi:hypothetical protein
MFIGILAASFVVYLLVAKSLPEKRYVGEDSPDPKAVAVAES